MDTGRVLLQVTRVPLLVALLLAAGSAQDRLAGAWIRLDVAEVWAPWLQMVGFGMVFATVALVGRRARHPASLLAVEGLVAAVVGLVPPVMWALWFGLAGFSRALGATSGNAFVQGLAIAWLIAVAVTGIRQARAPASEPTGAGASSARP